MDLDEALQTFIVEGRDLLEKMEEALLQVEQSPGDPDLVGAIFRAAHTIKGSAGLFGLDHVVQFTHVAESVLDRVRNVEIGIDSDLVALLLAVRDHLGALLDGIAEGREPDEEVHRSSEALAQRLRAYLGASAEQPDSAASHEAAVEPTSKRSWNIALRFGPDVLRNGLEPLAFIRYLASYGELDKVVLLTEGLPTLSEMDPETCYIGNDIRFTTEADRATIDGTFDFVRDDAEIQISQVDEAPAEAPVDKAESAACVPNKPAESAQKTNDKKPSKAVSGTDSASLIRVNAEKLDQHINLIGELIIASAGIQLTAQRERNTELLEAASLLARLVEEIRDSALQLRMVPIGATFNKFQRVVRDVSQELGKDIRLEISGAETELDKTVVEQIGDPLTHLVRNSMDHGIESAEVRTAQGKPAHGTVRLNAYHDAGSIVIEVSDDGGGLNRDRILAKAVDRGLVKADQTLSDNEVYNLIFEAGLSTAEKVNNLSGRGVGMDVVRRNITALRGTIDIKSALGRGTTMQIRLPLTLAIIDGFLVSVGGSSFVVPLDMVVECIELSEEDASGRDHLNLRGEVLPYIRLKELFAIEDSVITASTEQALEFEYVGPASHSSCDADNDLQAIQRQNVVVVQYAGHRAGLVVDNLLGEFQTVIRPLGDVFAGLEGISGFTILGSGQVALILDVPGLVRRVVRLDGRRHDASLTLAA